MRRAAVWVLHIGSCMDASLPEPLRLKEVPVVLNGGSGDGHGGERAKRLEEAFREAGLEPRLWPFGPGEEAREVARRALEARPPVLVAAGGGGAPRAGAGVVRGTETARGGGGDAKRGGGRAARNRYGARRDPGRNDESLRQGPGDSPGRGRGSASDWHRTVHSRGRGRGQRPGVHQQREPRDLRGHGAKARAAAAAAAAEQALGDAVGGARGAGTLAPPRPAPGGRRPGTGMPRAVRVRGQQRLCDGRLRDRHALAARRRAPQRLHHAPLRRPRPDRPRASRALRPPAAGRRLHAVERPPTPRPHAAAAPAGGHRRRAQFDGDAARVPHPAALAAGDRAVRTLAHLSDLHFGRVEPAVLEALRRRLRALAPDVVAVSGDLTQRARARQFREARAFLDSLPRPQVVVPGNHDVPLYNVFARFVAPLAGYRRVIGEDVEPGFVDDEIAVLGINTARSFVLKGGRVSESQLARLREALGRLEGARTRIVDEP